MYAPDDHRSRVGDTTRLVLIRLARFFECRWSRSRVERRIDRLSAAGPLGARRGRPHRNGEHRPSCAGTALCDDGVMRTVILALLTVAVALACRSALAQDIAAQGRLVWLL